MTAGPTLDDRARQATDVVLRDGSTVHVRLATSADEPAIGSFRAIERLVRGGGRRQPRPTSRRSPGERTDPSEPRCSVSLVAVQGPRHRVVGQASQRQPRRHECRVRGRRRRRLSGPRVGDPPAGSSRRDRRPGRRHHVRGDRPARERTDARGVSRERHPIAVRSGPGVVRVEISTSRRPRRGTGSSVARRSPRLPCAPLLGPAAIAVVVARAADDRRRPLPQRIDGGFTGPVYPVNPGATAVQGVRAYPDDPRHPASGRPGHRRAGGGGGDCRASMRAECVKGLVVISAGFSEVGGEDLDCRPSCSTSVARPACGSSARIAWASPTPTRPSR